MKLTKKILIGILTFLLLSVFMVSPIYAAIIEKTLSDEQMQIILSNSNTTGLEDPFNNKFAFGNATYTDQYTGAKYVVRGNRSGHERPATQSDVRFNLSMFLSGYDFITVQFIVAFNQSFNSGLLSRVQCVFDSTATGIDYSVVGTVNLNNVRLPEGASSSSMSYYGYIYQATISTEKIDYLRLRFDSFPTSYDYFIIGFVGIYVNGTSEALQNIDTQVSQIGTKIDDLTSAIQNAASDLGAVVDGQGNILSELEDIKDFADSIDQKQDVIIYATDNDQLIVSEFNERLSEVKDQLEDYKNILEQYYNPPDVSNVTNIINQGVPQEYNPQVVAPVLGVIFDNSIVTTILIAVLALATMSYVLFGKKR